MQKMKPGEKGSALVLTLFLVVISCVMAVGIMAYTSSQNRSSAFNINRINAQYIAEAGAKVAIANVLNTLKDNENNITSTNIGQFSKSAQKIKLADGNYTLSYGPNSNNPDDVSEVNITSVGSVNGANYRARVVIALANSSLAKESFGVVSLFKNAMYSHDPGTSIKKEDEQVWKITPATKEDPATATSPQATGNFQVKFNDKITDKTMSVSYNAACKNFDSYNSPCGYGIYYGMTGTADNPDGYVFQYDPGAGSDGSFFVKRVVARASAPGYAYDNEYNYAKNSYYNENKRRKGTTGCEVPFQPTKSYTNAKDYYEAKVNDGNDITWVSLKGTGPNSLLSIMKKAGYPDFDINAQHKITIEVDKNGVHVIKCDGVMILHFEDRTAGKKSVKNTSTGLRTWNADIDFYNDPNEIVNQKPASTIIWRK